MNTTSLVFHDLQWCLRRAPRELLALMKKHGAGLMIAGGYIRACIASENVNDVDCFAPSKEVAKAFALELAGNDEKRVHETDNAYTIRGLRFTVQIIHRWTFTDPVKAIESFDFTVARAAIWWNATYVWPIQGPARGRWESVCDARFYPDLAGKRLIYCSPLRVEDAGGSMLRVLKFYQRGYRIPIDSLGAVIARLAMGVTESERRTGESEEARMARIITGLLREVDPDIDPKHLAHLPAENIKDAESEGV